MPTIYKTTQGDTWDMIAKKYTGMRDIWIT